ncbi:HET-domain-containing protein [Nemania sp. FL0916]|nr:HET-domain-containing protein [Nemania sp. FL0916]
MPLCARCEQKSDPYANGFSLKALKNSTCEFCGLVYRGLMSVLSSTNPDERFTASLPPFSRKKNSGFEVNVMFSHATVSFWCSWGTTCPWGILPTHRDITPVLHESEGSFQTALDWIEDCTTHHHCGAVAAPPTLPTRVVDTGLHGGPIRVVEGASRHGRYICLSHCWGQERPLMTVSKTLQNHMREISWDSIPATFQEAISISKKLGIQYLWIDSLCIIQDSKEDWERESSKMADIYRNSYVTLAAASSKDSKGGLGLDKPRQPGATLNGTTSDGKPYSIRVQCSIQPHAHIDDATPKDGIQHPVPPTTSTSMDFGGALGVFPLLTRAWVFQERLLSPRFLQFGRDELLWDCRESMLCECGQRPPDLPYNQVTVKKNEDGNEDGDGDGLLAHKWRKIVEVYCALNLTCPDDKLPALSGLAKLVRERKQKPRATTTTMYLAGLWSDSLELDLVWIACGGPERQSQEVDDNDEYIAPSWSWASVHGQKIIYPNLWRAEEDKPSVRVLDVYFELVKAHATPSSIDPTGKVTEAAIVLRSPLFRISAHGSLSNDEDGDGQVIEFRYGDTPFTLCTRRDTESLNSNWRLPFTFQRRRAFLDSLGEIRRRLVGNKNLYCCRVSRVEVLENSIYILVTQAREVIHVEFSLLLERVGSDDDDGAGVFRRVGLLADGRIIEGHQGDAESWDKEPSVFESGGDAAVVTIV